MTNKIKGSRDVSGDVSEDVWGPLGSWIGANLLARRFLLPVAECEHGPHSEGSVRAVGVRSLVTGYRLSLFSF